MPSLREYFVGEAEECLGRLNALVQSAGGEGAGEVDGRELHRLARVLRGSARIAGEDRVHRVARALESAARRLMTGELTWTPEVAERLRRTLDDVRALVHDAPAPERADAIVAQATSLWRDLGVELPGGAAAPVPAALAASTGEFRAFVAGELTGVVAALDAALEALARDARDREPLLAILRRQRALMGAAGLRSEPVIAGTLKALEDITRFLSRLDAPAHGEWLDAYRSAREVLVAALAALERAEQVPQVPELSRLRTIHQELTERFGKTEAPPDEPAIAAALAATEAGTASPAPTPERPAGHAVPAGRAAPAGPATGTMEPVPIETLCYRGEAALRHALELRPQIEAVLARRGDVTSLLDELFDLIRLGLT